MTTALAEFEKLAAGYATGVAVTRGQMFGKACLKVGGKAFVAMHKEVLAFKLSEPRHSEAIGLPGAELWNPSGGGRPMKKWVAVPAIENKSFRSLPAAAHAFVSDSLQRLAPRDTV